MAAKERLKSPRARLFVALELPEGIRAGVEEWGRKALDDPVLRRLPADSLHVTLAFLGFRPEKEVGRIAAVVEVLEGPPPLIELRGPVARPPRGRPRLFALPVESPETVSLQADLAARLASEGLYEPEKRPFWPHLTVARVRPGFELRINKSEVDDAFEVPLAFLMDPANHQLHSREFRGMERSYYAMPFAERYIWGATAGILRVLYERIYLP